MSLFALLSCIPRRRGIGVVLVLVICSSVNRVVRSSMSNQCLSHLAVRRFKLEVVSATHDLDPGTRQLPFQLPPIIGSLDIIVLIVDGSHDIYCGKPPAIALVVPYGTVFPVVEKAYGFFGCLGGHSVSASSSAMMASMSARNLFSCATMRRMRSFSSRISVCGWVSSAST